MAASEPVAPEPHETPYADAVAGNAADDLLRLNIPGHSADEAAAPELSAFFGTEVLKRDISPLLSGIDKGPNNPYERSLILAAEAWGAQRSWFLTNGASQANRIGALALGAFGREEQPVVVQRSAHSSFIDGMILAGLTPTFALPVIDASDGIAHGVSPDELRRALEAAIDPKGVYVVSPSYFGAVSDVAALAHIAHEAKVPILVDESWGAHFGFHPNLPGNSLSVGADLVVSSTHKLGGSLTQSAMIHLGHGPFADALEPLVHRAFLLTMSTSASALLLASLDIARHALRNAPERIGASIEAAERIREKLRSGGRFRIVSDGWGRNGAVASDPLRISVDVRSAGLNGHAVRDELIRMEGIYTEIATDACVVAFLGPGFEPDADRFVDALHRMTPNGSLAYAETLSLALPRSGELRMRPRDAWFARSATVAVADAIGRVSADSLAAYPPGIPNVLPGEVISSDVVHFLRAVAASPGGHVRGASDPALDHIRVVEE